MFYQCKPLLFWVFLLYSLAGISQVGIGTDNPNNAAALDIVSTTKGVLISRMSESQRLAISSPVTGLLVYQSNSTAGFYYYDGSQWLRLLEGTSFSEGIPVVVLEALALKEDKSNKSIDLTVDSGSDVKYPSVKAVVDYVTARVSGSSGSSGSDGTSGSGSGTSSDSVPDATTSVKGIIQLAGDLSGTAANPTIANGAVSAAQTDGSLEITANKSTSISADGSSNTKYPTVKAVKDYVDASSSSSGGSGGSGSGSGGGSGSGSVSDASTTSKGIVQLAGDLSGTAASPSVAAAAITTSKIADAAITTSKLSTAAVTAAKTDGSLELTTNKTTSIATDGSSDTKYPTAKAVKTYVDANISTVSDATTLAKGVLQLAGDLSGTAALPTIANAAVTTTKIADDAITTDKIADNAVSTAKLSDAAVTAAKTDGSLELTANKSISVTTDATSDSKYPSVKAVKTYVDNAVSTGSMTDATTSAKGAVQLAGDLAGTADAPLIGNLKVTGAKIANSTIALNTKVTGTLPVSNGGTGVTTLTGLVKGNGSSAFSAAVVGTDYSLVREVADEFTASSSQTTFTLSQTPSTASKVRMFINGVRISNSAYSHSGRTLTYNPTNNGSYSLTTGDRIQFDYYY